ncbi:aluminum-activated malate transporter 2-like [Actinidia eriantha]|uniref:aluminum-activated malate transporter 2-like n=1 Tax=Actinidia eriantha TaxID=165200 RepID=UPI0025838284|nr:aluminum-activated malate transporter 2-like [Actinidia eriantha]
MAFPSSDPINTVGVCNWFKTRHEKLRSKVSEVAKEAKKLGEDDPRRIIHSIKVGIAICLVSLIYYFDPLYEGFGISAMWAVMTVVVIFEFSVGATLGRGFNRSVATLIAGGLGVGAHRLASYSGETWEPMVLGLIVFLLAGVVTFVRFFPKMKARYDYGLLIFILTFCLICVSGYRDDEVLDMANIRLSTVIIGGVTAVIICLCIRPVWAGDDLHNLVALNMETLANSLQGFGAEYFRTQEDEECSKEEDPKLLMQGYKDVLNSKSAEESLANSAKWEPRHGRFRYRHPWNQYLKIGALTRQCACRMEALHGYLNSEIQASPEVRAKIEEPCTKMSTECSYVLNDLSLAIKTMTWPSSANSHIVNSKTAAEDLKSSLKTEPWPSTADLLEIIPVAAVASLLIDVVTCTEKIAESVLELASITNMKKLEQPDQRPMQPKRLNHVISIDVPAQGPAE